MPDDVVRTRYDPAVGGLTDVAVYRSGAAHPASEPPESVEIGAELRAAFEATGPFEVCRLFSPPYSRSDRPRLEYDLSRHYVLVIPDASESDRVRDRLRAVPDILYVKPARTRYELRDG